MTATTMTRTANWPLVWALWIVAGVLLEGIALGEPQAGDSLSEFVRVIRFDSVGRFVILPLSCWLAYHWLLKRNGEALFTWRDLIGLLVGFAWAIAETLAAR